MLSSIQGAGLALASNHAARRHLSTRGIGYLHGVNPSLAGWDLKRATKLPTSIPWRMKTVAALALHTRFPASTKVARTSRSAAKAVTAHACRSSSLQSNSSSRCGAAASLTVEEIDDYQFVHMLTTRGC